MKKVFILFIAILYFFPSNCFAYKNEPDGFRDLYWGESLQEVQKTHPDAKYDEYHSEENAVSYVIEFNNPYVSNVLADKEHGIKIYFWNNQLYRVKFYFEADTLLNLNANYIRLQDAMTLNFGNPSINNLVDTKNRQTYTAWQGFKTTIILFKDINQYYIEVSLVNLNLMNKAIKDVASKGW